MSTSEDQEGVPSDFPRTREGSLSGLQPKLSARLIDGQVVAGMTEDELFARFEACQDLVVQLAEYAKRKQALNPAPSLKDFLRRLRQAVVSKGWDLDVLELDWVMQRVAVELGGSPADAPGVAVLIAPAVAISPDYTPVLSVVDLALSRLPKPTEPT